ncbi:MAG TPA: c-type cytochrome [Caulobacteraceae bacterium]|nr:c-type cytochrome [Caulobacteraceae bacterium]
MRRQLLPLLAVVGLALAGPSLGIAQAIADHPLDYAPADIAYGAKLYGEQCVACHAATGDGVGGIDFKRGTFHSVVTDRDMSSVITGGVAGKGMPAFKLDPTEVTGLVAYIRNFNSVDRSTIKLGDAARGKAIFEGKGECGTCHRVNGVGPRSAPDLSDIGAVRSAASIQRTLTDPSSQMMPINRPVHIVTKDGKVINGRRLNEDTYSLQLMDDHENLVSLNKADLKEFVISTKSPMPAYKDRLSADELADLMSYLLALKGK